MSGYKHGWYGTVEYQAWQSMKSRCYNPNNPSFNHYGGRGISVCDRWRKSFVAFINDVGVRPSDRHSLDRINNDRNYTKGNCKWSISTDQQRNKRCNTIINFNGLDKPQIFWLEKYKIPKTTFNNRIKRGWSLRRALTEPIIIERRNSKAKGKIDK